MNSEQLTIACADIGSIQNKKFGWAVLPSSSPPRCGTEIEKLVRDVGCLVIKPAG